MMFGDVGGLRDFLGLGLATVFGFFSEHFMTASLIKSLYRATTAREN